MTAGWRRRAPALALFALAAAVLPGLAQTPAKPPTAAAERESRASMDASTGAGRRQAEDVVAKHFEAIRQRAHLRPLSRIVARSRLDQLVCSAAATGKPVPLDTAATSALYLTSQISAGDKELRHAALFDDSHSRDPGKVSRFAVAVWQASTPDAAGHPQLWVGVALYLGPVHEWVAEHLTTRRKTREELQFSIVPACREMQ